MKTKADKAAEVMSTAGRRKKGRRVNWSVFERWNISRGLIGRRNNSGAIFRRGDRDSGVFGWRRKVNSGAVFCMERGVWKAVYVVSHVAVEPRPLTGDARRRTHERAPGLLLGQLCIHFRCHLERSDISAQRTACKGASLLNQFAVADSAAAVSVDADDRVPQNSPTNKSHGQTCTDVPRRALLS